MAQQLQTLSLQKRVIDNKTKEAAVRRIKVVGFEDPMQRMLLHNVEAAIRDLKCEFTIDIIHDLNDIIKMEKAQIIVTPALIVDSHILCEGHIWNVEHIKHFLNKICQSDTE